MGEMADLTYQWGEEAEFKRSLFRPINLNNDHLQTFNRVQKEKRQMAYKKYGNKGGNNNNRPQTNYRTVGNIVLWYNVGNKENNEAPLFNGLYALTNEDESISYGELAVWRSRKYDEYDPKSVFATGKTKEGHVVFLRKSNKDTIKFFGSIVEQDGEDLGAQICQFTLFDGDNSTAWSGTLQIAEDEGAAPKSSSPSPKTSGSKSGGPRSKPKNDMPY